MSDVSLFAPTHLGSRTLRNRLVMAPMTRSRATPEGVPTPLMAEYYGQRAEAGLIVTEGTTPSPNGRGYARIPGIWSQAQEAGWRQVTGAVHAKGGAIFLQLMHTGRVSNALNLPPGAEILAPSAVPLPGEMYTDSKGLQPHGAPRAMTDAEVRATAAEYVAAARRAVAAGFDGVELHGANGYLMEQFLNPGTNLRQDDWGGPIENRVRFILEVAHATSEAIGGERVGLRISPHGAFNAMAPYPEVDETYRTLVKRLAATGVQYLHLLDHSAQGAPPVPEPLKRELRQLWPRTLILAGGFDRASAEAAVREGRADLVAMGRPFIANPDLVTRLQRELPLAELRPASLYTPGPAGYTDYPRAA
jgi:N-ethylmaleimide reductase